MTVLVDADACPVKREIAEAAIRRGVRAIFVSGQYLRLPEHPLVKLYVAGAGFDAADDAIAAVAKPGTVTITADVPLAHRVVEAGGAVLTPRGHEFDASNVGVALAQRDLKEALRGGVEGGAGVDVGRGPAPFDAAARRRFVDALDRVLTRFARGG